MPRRHLAIPKRLTIRGRSWTVRYSGARRPKRRAMRGLAGECDAERHTIWISARESRREQERTLVHEILHALIGEESIPNEEQIVGRLERPLHALLASGQLVATPEEVRR